jgi:hypothetical protein
MPGKSSSSEHVLGEAESDTERENEWKNKFTKTGMVNCLKILSVKANSMAGRKLARRIGVHELSESGSFDARGTV